MHCYARHLNWHDPHVIFVTVEKTVPWKLQLVKRLFVHKAVEMVPLSKGLFCKDKVCNNGGKVRV